MFSSHIKLGIQSTDKSAAVSPQFRKNIEN